MSKRRYMIFWFLLHCCTEWCCIHRCIICEGCLIAPLCAGARGRTRARTRARGRPRPRGRPGVTPGTGTRRRDVPHHAWPFGTSGTPLAPRRGVLRREAATGRLRG